MNNGSCNCIDANITLSCYSLIGNGVCNYVIGNNSAIINGGTCLTGIGLVGNSALTDFAFIGNGVGNMATARGGTIGNGLFNTANGLGSFVGNGVFNVASGYGAFIANGLYNVVTASGYYSSIGGGVNNCIDTNTLSGQYSCCSVIGGGTFNYILGMGSVIAGGGTCKPGAPFGNTICSDFSMIGSGFSNLIDTGSCVGFIGGGFKNSISSSSSYSVVGGGFLNSIATGWSSFIGGGGGNMVSAYYSAIAGGNSNTICSCSSYGFIGSGFGNSIGDNAGINMAHGNFIGGGSQNCIDAFGNDTSYAVIAGGSINKLCAGAIGSSILGGIYNTISSYYSTVGGGNSNTLYKGADYSFIGSGDANLIGDPIGVNLGQFNAIVSGIGNCIDSSAGITRGNAILGGVNHAICSGSVYSSILGGSGNIVQHNYATVAGYNVVSASDCAFHANCLIGANTPLWSSILPPGTISYYPAPPGLGFPLGSCIAMVS